MKLKAFIVSCLVFFTMCCVCSAEYIPETYIYEAETTPFTVNGEEKEIAPETEDDITYLTYAGEKGGNITFKFNVPESGRYEINIKIRKMYDESKTSAYTWKVDGTNVKYKVYYDKTNSKRFFFNKWMSIDLGQFDLKEGDHTVSVVCDFSYASWNGTELDIDAIELKKSNSKTIFLYNEYQNQKVTASHEGGISKAVENDVYSTIVYGAQNSEEYLSVDFEMETCGVFDFDIIVKAGGTTSGIFNVYIDDVLIQENLDFTLAKYGSEWAVIPFGTSELTIGKHNIKLVAIGGKKAALLSEIKISAVCEGSGAFSPCISDENGNLSEITKAGDITVTSSVYNYGEEKEYLLVFLYYDKTGGASVLKDIAMVPVTVPQGKCEAVKCPVSITEMYEEGTVSAFVCDYTEGIVYPDTEVVTIPCNAS